MNLTKQGVSRLVADMAASIKVWVRWIRKSSAALILIVCHEGTVALDSTISSRTIFHNYTETYLPAKCQQRFSSFQIC